MIHRAPPVGPSFLVSQVGAHAARLFAVRLATLDLRPHHAGILRIVGHDPDLSQQALSDTLGMFPSQLVRLLDELEDRRLLERRPSPGDRRSYRLRLTRGGESALGEIDRLTRDLEAALFGALSADDLGHLERALRRVAATHGLAPGVHPAIREPAPPSKKSEKKEVRTVQHTFSAKIHRGSSKNVTGIVVPPAVLAALGAGKQPKVKVTLNGYTYRSSVGTMGGEAMISLSAAHRAAAGLTGDDAVEVRLEIDTAPRDVAVPDDLRQALVTAKALAAFEAAAPSRRKEFVRQVEEAKAPETRARRVARIVETLQGAR